MDQSKKDTIGLHLELLKTMMKEEGLIFGIVVNKQTPDQSSIAFVDFAMYCQGKRDGIVISLDDLNEGLIPERKAT